MLTIFTVEMYTIDLVGNLTGTSLTTFMLCTVELMLAGLCINIPMLRPFYTRFRAKYKTSSMSKSGGQGSHKASGSRQLGAVQARPANYMAWIELVSTPGLRILQTESNKTQDDKDQTLVTSDDASSERKLTSDQPSDAIHVQKDWVISRV